MSDGIVEVIVGRQRRRRWTVEEKLRIDVETDEPGARIGDVAARHDVYPGLRHCHVNMRRRSASHRAKLAA